MQSTRFEGGHRRAGVLSGKLLEGCVGRVVIKGKGSGDRE